MAKPRKVLLQLTTVSFEMHHPHFEDIMLPSEQQGKRMDAASLANQGTPLRILS